LNNTQFSNDPSEVTGLKLGQTAVQSNVHAAAAEINVPDPNMTTDQVSEDGTQYVNQLPTSNTIVDLTTYDGMSTLTRTIRLFADEGPNRGSDSTTALPPATVVPATINPLASIYMQPAPTTGAPINIAKIAGIPVSPSAATASPVSTAIAKLASTLVK
jgi:hypothetical protein